MRFYKLFMKNVNDRVIYRGLQIIRKIIKIIEKKASLIKQTKHNISLPIRSTKN